MIDIHSHLIYGVDDGSFSMEESIKMLSAASKLGIETIIATPHYQKQLYENAVLIDNFKRLAEAAAERRIDLRLGSELYANEDLIGYIRRKRKKSKFKAQYLMIEIPFVSGSEDAKKILKRLLTYQVKIIIAHPERNLRLMNEMKSFVDFTKVFNISLQVDAGSIAGSYGLKVKDHAKKLINLGRVDFMASNAHNSYDYAKVYGKAVETVYKWCSTEDAIRLLKQNANLILARKPFTYYRNVRLEQCENDREKKA